MKKLIPIIIITFNLFLLHSCFKANDNIAYDGRCTGSDYCTACSNCSRCGHCSSGGTCGVCSGSSSGSSSSSGKSSKRSKSKKHKTSDSYKSPKISSNPPKVFVDKVNVKTNNKYLAGIAITNIYEKPSVKSKIIASVPKNTKLIQLSKLDSWYKVQIKKGGKIGYVFYKDVNN